MLIYNGQEYESNYDNYAVYYNITIQSELSIEDFLNELRDGKMPKANISLLEQNKLDPKKYEKITLEQNVLYRIIADHYGIMPTICNNKDYSIKELQDISTIVDDLWEHDNSIFSLYQPEMEDINNYLTLNKYEQHIFNNSDVDGAILKDTLKAIKKGDYYFTNDFESFLHKIHVFNRSIKSEYYISPEFISKVYFECPNVKNMIEYLGKYNV